jgi:hypothetical protein
VRGGDLVAGEVQTLQVHGVLEAVDGGNVEADQDQRLQLLDG